MAMSGKTTRARERRANLRFSIAGPLLAKPGEDELQAELEQLAPTQGGHWAVMPRLWIILDAHSRSIRRVQWCFGETAEGRVHELYQDFLKRALPTLLLIDNGPAMRVGRKGSDGDVRR
jgi:hypothetical protein